MAPRDNPKLLEAIQSFWVNKSREFFYACIKFFMNKNFCRLFRLLIDFYGVGWAYTIYLTKYFFSFSLSYVTGFFRTRHKILQLKSAQDMKWRIILFWH